MTPSLADDDPGTAGREGASGAALRSARELRRSAAPGALGCWCRLATARRRSGGQRAPG